MSTSSNNRTIIAAGLLVAAALAFSGCSRQKDAQAAGIEAIQKQDGVPVNVRRIEPEDFRRYLSFTATLSGAEESTATSLLTDEVAGVLYEVGDYVKQGATVVVFPPDSPSLNYEQARVRFESARQAFERVRKLYDQDGISRQAYDDARTQYEIARANWDSIQQITEVQAPISGYITRINVLESDNVEPGDPLFTVSDYRSMKSTVWLTDRQISEVRVGEHATATWQEKMLEGKVIQVDLAMDQKRKAFAAKVRFDNPDRTVQSGVTATVKIQSYRNEQALVLDSREIVRDSDGSFVYVLDGNTVQRRPVRLGKQEGLSFEVVDGLESGEQIVTNGIDQVHDGSLVNVVEAQPRLARQERTAGEVNGSF